MRYKNANQNCYQEVNLKTKYFAEQIDYSLQDCKQILHYVAMCGASLVEQVFSNALHQINLLITALRITKNYSFDSN